MHLWPFFFFKLPLCMYFWLCCVLVAEQAFLELQQAGAALWLKCMHLLWWLLTPWSTGCRVYWLRYLRHVGSGVVVPGL